MRLLGERLGATLRVGQCLAVGLARSFGLGLHAAGALEILRDPGAPGVQDILHPGQGDARHQEVERAEDDHQPDELRQEVVGVEGREHARLMPGIGVVADGGGQGRSGIGRGH